MAVAKRRALVGWAALVVFGAHSRVFAAGAETVLYLEQHIDFSSASGMQQSNVHRLWYDGRRLRAEIEGGKQRSVLLLEAPGEEVKLLFPAIRSWARYRLEEYVQALTVRFGRLSDDEITLEEGTEEENVGAFRCRRFILRAAGPGSVQSELCLAQVPGFKPGLYAELVRALGLQAVLGRLFEKLQGLEQVPVYVRSRRKSGEEQVLVEQRLIKAERRPAEPGLFSVPADFQELLDLALPKAEQGGGK